MGGRFFEEEQTLDSGEENYVSATLPYFVGDAIIMTQLIVCQEKNSILEFFFPNFFSFSAFE